MANRKIENQKLVTRFPAHSPPEPEAVVNIKGSPVYKFIDGNIACYYFQDRPGAPAESLSCVRVKPD